MNLLLSFFTKNVYNTKEVSHNLLKCFKQGGNNVEAFIDSNSLL